MHTLSCLACAALAVAAGTALAAPPSDPPYQPRFARNEIPSAPISAPSCMVMEYPKTSLRNEETGITILALTISPAGRLLSTTVAQSSGFPALDQAAMAGAAKAHCKFKPSTIDGKPVQSITPMAFRWTLE